MNTHQTEKHRERTTNQPTNTISFKEATRCYLTEAEIRVLKLIAKRFTCKEIAKKLGNKTSTIQTHRKRIKKKLELKGHGSLERWCWEYEEKIREYIF
jgi:DNA-binding CsgD family transcriptional regulator